MGAEGRAEGLQPSPSVERWQSQRSLASSRAAGHHPGPEHAPAVSPQVKTRAQPTQIHLQVGATGHRFEAGADAFENRLVGRAQVVIHPATVAPLLDQARPLQDLQVPAHIGLGHAEGIDELAHASPTRNGEQTAGEPQADGVAERGEELVHAAGGRIHVFQSMNIWTLQTCVARLPSSSLTALAAW